MSVISIKYYILTYLCKILRFAILILVWFIYVLFLAELPVISEPPTILSVTSSEVILSWPSWYLQQTTLVIESYAVEKLADTPSSQWTEVSRLPANKLNTSYQLTLGGLEPGMLYSFRINIIWLNSNKSTPSKPGPSTQWITTLCGIKAILI